MLLLSVDLLRLPTAVLADHLREGARADRRVTVALYGASLSLMGIAFTIFWRYLLRHHELHRPNLDRKALAVRRRRDILGLVAYPVVTPLVLLGAPLFITLTPAPDIRGDRPRQDDHGEQVWPSSLMIVSAQIVVSPTQGMSSRPRTVAFGLPQHRLGLVQGPSPRRVIEVWMAAEEVCAHLLLGLIRASDMSAGEQPR